MNLVLTDSITIPDDVLFRELDEEAVLLNLRTGVYFGLNSVGTRMWQLLADRLSLARVLETMANEYDVDRGVLQEDLMELVRQLCAKGLGEIVSA